MGNLISIIIPTFNRQEELVVCLKKLENQTLKNFEVVVVDDCSTEHVDLSSLEFSFGLIFHRNSINLGASGARNKGVELASSPWLLFLDDDDIFVDNKIEVITKKITSDSDNIDFIYHRAKIHMVNERVSYLTSVKSEKKLSLEKLLKGNYIGGAPVFAIKKSIFNEVGGFDETLPAIEDYDLLLRLAERGSVKINFVDQVLTECFYYTKRKSVSKNILALKTSAEIIFSRYAYEVENKNLDTNKYIMLAHAELMNLQRVSGVYYLKAFIRTLGLRYFVAGVISIINPTFLIRLRSNKEEI